MEGGGIKDSEFRSHILSVFKDVNTNSMCGFGREGFRTARSWFAQVPARTVVAREFAVRSKASTAPKDAHTTAPRASRADYAPRHTASYA